MTGYLVVMDKGLGIKAMNTLQLINNFPSCRALDKRKNAILCVNRRLNHRKNGASSDLCISGPCIHPFRETLSPVKRKAYDLVARGVMGLFTFGHMHLINRLYS